MQHKSNKIEVMPAPALEQKAVEIINDMSSTAKKLLDISEQESLSGQDMSELLSCTVVLNEWNKTLKKAVIRQYY